MAEELVDIAVIPKFSFGGMAHLVGCVVDVLDGSLDGFLCDLAVVLDSNKHGLVVLHQTIDVLLDLLPPLGLPLLSLHQLSITKLKYNKYMKARNLPS